MEQFEQAYAHYGSTATEPFDLTSDAKRIRRYLELAFIASGRGPNLASISADLDLSRDATREALSLLQKGVQVLFVPGTEDILKLPPFSNVPTRHAVTVDGEAKWFSGCAGESCAIDALFPGKEVVIASSCPDCWQPIEMVVRDRQLLSLKPATAVVHWGRHPRDLPHNWTVSCDRINFFVDAEHARAWEDTVTGEPGILTSVGLTLRSVDGIARKRHWDYDRGPEIFPPGGGPLVAALAEAGADLAPWEI